MIRFRLRTLMIVLAVLPPILGSAISAIVWLSAIPCPKLIDDNRVPVTEVSELSGPPDNRP
jgi:hypothetical protein